MVDRQDKNQNNKEVIRQQIKVLELIEALENHVIHGVEMSSTQVNAALALLKKTLPDIQEAKKTGKDDKDIAAREIALAFNIPAQLVGIEGSLTYANFEQARLALYDDAILPLLNHFKGELNNWLTPQFGDDLELDYDLDAIEALAPRREKVWARLGSADFMTINEKRAVLGLSRVFA